MAHYIVTSKTDATAMHTSEQFADRASAFAYINAHALQSTHAVTFVCSEDEQYEWRRRERRRFYNDEYTPVPWQNDCWYVQYLHVDHYAHVSTEDKTMVAYTPDDEHGVSNRKTRVTPGRYLQRFAFEKLYAEYLINFQNEYERQRYIADYVAMHRNAVIADTPETVAKHAADCRIADYVATFKSYSQGLQIAYTAVDIRKVFTSGPANEYHQHSPTSCMSYRTSTYDTNGVHPTEVYGNDDGHSDLAVAYLGTLGTSIKARAVIWPDKQRYSTIYGDDALAAVLKTAGYTRGSMSGAKVRKIAVRSRYQSSYVMPYVDGCYTVIDCGSFFRLSDSEYGNDYTCHETCGTVGDVEPEENTCSECGNECGSDEYCYSHSNECSARRCYVRISEDDEYCSDHMHACGNDSCNARISEYAYNNDEYYCSDCERNHYFCESCETDHFDGESKTYDDRTLCSDCYRSECIHECASDECDQTFDVSEFTDQEIADRESFNVHDLCTDCAHAARTCNRCNHINDRDTLVCSDCGMAYRCSETANLFATSDHTSPDNDRWTIETDRVERDNAIMNAAGNTSPAAFNASALVQALTDNVFATPRAISEYEAYSAANGTGDLSQALRNSVWRTARSTGQCLIWTCRTVIAVGTRYAHSPAGFGYCRHCASGTGVPVDTLATAGALQSNRGTTVPGNGIWYQLTDISNRYDLLSQTFWYFDGCNGWHTTRANHFILQPSEFTPETMMESVNAQYYRVIPDPRVQTTDQRPMIAEYEHDLDTLRNV